VGPLGLAHVIKARMMGAGRIIVTDISDYRLGLAKEFGADISINSKNTTEDERLDIVMCETRGRGADLVIECVGLPSVVPEGLKMLRKAGMYLEPGNFVDTGSVPINIHEICAKNLRIVGMCNHAHNAYLPCMEMMERSLGWFPWEKFVSHVYPLKQAEEAVKKSMAEDSMKVVIAANL
jgi:L-iditol 2-dehydrogenase